MFLTILINFLVVVGIMTCLFWMFLGIDFLEERYETKKRIRRREKIHDLEELRENFDQLKKEFEKTQEGEE